MTALPSAVNSSARAARIAALKATMKERILVLDGAMGTQIFAHNLKALDFGGAKYEGCVDYLAITRRARAVFERGFYGVEPRREPTTG